MTREVFTDLTTEAWLEKRAADVTSTEVAALFGLSPYDTPYSLWHRKKNNLTVEFDNNSRVRLGKHLQAGIAAYIAEENNWQIKSLDGTYMRLAAHRIGSSFDYEAIDPVRGKGLIECKNVDYLVHRDNWAADEAPDHIEIQVQHEMLVSGYSWCAMAVLVGGNNPKVIFREADKEIALAIIKKAGAFWDSIEANDEPSPDFLRDYKLLEMIYDKRDKTKIIELPDLEAKLIRYKQIQEAEKIFEGEKNEIKALLLTNSQEAGKVFAGTMQASISKVEGSPDIIWTKAMTEELIGKTKSGRAGYNRITVNERKV